MMPVHVGGRLADSGLATLHSHPTQDTLIRILHSSVIRVQRRVRQRAARRCAPRLEMQSGFPASLSVVRRSPVLTVEWIWMFILDPEAALSSCVRRWPSRL